MNTKPRKLVQFTQPVRQLTFMLIALGLIGAGAWLIQGTILNVLKSNLYLNGAIVAVFVLGVLACFWQVLTLGWSVRWIERFVGQGAGAETAKPPQMLAPLAQLLRAGGTNAEIPSSSARSILDSIASRIDEARDFTRYITNLLVFLGLLGTFYGLATTVPAVVETIRALSPAEGETGLDVFSKLMGGLESQLGGMGTAFSSSLLGLAGSLVIGLLELFAGHGQNRFYRELEEWISSITRFGFAGGGDGDGEGVAAVMEHLAAQVDSLADVLVQQANVTAQNMAALTVAIETLNARTKEESGSEAESRMRLRSIDVQLLKILEEMAAGRQEMTASLTAAIRALRAPAGKP